MYFYRIAPATFRYLLVFLVAISFLSSTGSPLYAEETMRATAAAYDEADEEISVLVDPEPQSVVSTSYTSEHAVGAVYGVVDSAYRATEQVYGVVDSAYNAVYGAVVDVYGDVYGVTGQVYQPLLNPVLPALAGAKNGFLAEEANSTGYHYIVSAPAGAYKAEGMLQLPKSFKLNAHSVFKAQMNNDVPYFFFGIYTAKGGLDVGICWQKTPQHPEGVWLTFCTVFPKSGNYYTHPAGSEIPGLKAEQILHMTAIQYDDGVRMELRSVADDGSQKLIKSVDFDIPSLALRADGRGTYFNREISLAQHSLNYTNGAELIGSRWWDAKLTWTNYSSSWNSGVVSLGRTRWEPVSEMRVVRFEQHPYDAEEVSFIYSPRTNAKPAGK